MRNKRRDTAICMLLLSAAALSGCSGKKTITRDDARAELKQAASLTAESQLFIDYMRAERSTRPYIERHLEYLSKAVQQQTRTLEEARPEPDAATAVDECLSALRRLKTQLKKAQEQMKNADRRP